MEEEKRLDSQITLQKTPASAAAALIFVEQAARLQWAEGGMLVPIGVKKKQIQL